MKYEWCLFDLDGTLFDFDLAKDTALKRSFEYYGLNFRDEYIEQFDKINIKVWQQFEQGRITIPQLKGKRFELLFEKNRININPELFGEYYLKSLSSFMMLKMFNIL